MALSRHLLREANRGQSRTEFLREASVAILGFTGAAKLDLWLEDGDLCYHWHAIARPKPKFHLTSLTTATARERDSRSGSLLERVAPLVTDEGGVGAAADGIPGRSLWVGVAALIVFEIDAQNEGVLRLTNPESGQPTPTQAESYEGLAQLLGVAISNRRAKRALTERVKELTCMYRIAQIASESNLDLDDTLQEIVELLPRAWQYPDLATARIVLGERSFISTGFAVGPHHVSAEVLARGEPRGRVEVFYTETVPHTLDDGHLPMEEPFLAEEQHLIAGVAREITSIIERKHAEEEKLALQEQIRHADRLVTIGQLAAGVAHELNEPLGNILGFAQLANKSTGLAEQLRSDIEKIVQASLYAREIIRNLMFFSRQAPARKTDLSLNKVVEDGLPLLESRCEKAGITVVRKIDPALPTIHGDSAQLQQVLVNLVVNAIQAMPEGGTLTITTSLETNYRRLIVEDTGAGIAPDDIKSVFLPFFTTKEVGEGTGLGLSVVHGIVKSHGGSVHVESAVGGGTRFEVRLPADADIAAEKDGAVDEE